MAYSSYEDDKDFIQFWKSCIQFFAYYVILARKYSKFFENEELLLEFLRQRGLLICDDETFSNLTFLLHNYYSEIRKRGTIQIISNYSNIDPDESDSNSSSESNTINGELLRLICFDSCDEFIFNFRKIEKIGFNIRNSSPLYKGTSNMEGLNKIWAKLLSSLDYLSYPLFGSVSSISELDESDSDSNSDALINSGYAIQINSGTSGIGLDNISFNTLGYINQYAINVDKNIDYEFSFRVKQDILSLNSLNFGINAFDCAGNAIDLLKITDLSSSISLLSVDSLNQINKYYFFRGIIYSKNKFPLFDNSISYKKDFIVRDVSDDFWIAKQDVSIGILLSNTSYWRILTTDEKNSLTLTSWGRGNNLQFTNNVVKVIPYIKIINADVNSHTFIDDIKLSPVATNYSSGFIQTSKWVDFWIKNNNGYHTYSELKTFFRKYLLPYDIEFDFNQLEEEIVE